MYVCSAWVAWCLGRSPVFLSPPGRRGISQNCGTRRGRASRWGGWSAIQCNAMQWVGGGDQHGLVTLACTEFTFASSLSFLESLPGIILGFFGEYIIHLPAGKSTSHKQTQIHENSQIRKYMSKYKYVHLQEAKKNWLQATHPGGRDPKPTQSFFRPQAAWRFFFCNVFGPKSMNRDAWNGERRSSTLPWGGAGRRWPPRLQ